MILRRKPRRISAAACSNVQDNAGGLGQQVEYRCMDPPERATLVLRHQIGCREVIAGHHVADAEIVFIV